MITIIKKKKIENLKNENIFLRNQINDLSTQFFGRGGHLTDEIFIPEYLGFNETQVLTDKGVKRIYSKECNEDAFHLVRSDTTDNQWVLTKRGISPIALKIKSMLHAIIVLDSLGFDIDVEAYANGARQQ